MPNTQISTYRIVNLKLLRFCHFLGGSRVVQDMLEEEILKFIRLVVFQVSPNHGSINKYLNGSTKRLTNFRVKNTTKCAHQRYLGIALLLERQNDGEPPQAHG